MMVMDVHGVWTIASGPVHKSSTIPTAVIDPG